MTTTRPPDPPGGQDDPPDVRTAVHATLRILDEIVDRGVLADDHELFLRVAAIRSALNRLRRHLERGGSP